jgi:hypothetical protein
MFDWLKVCVGPLKNTTIQRDSGCTQNYGLVTSGGKYRFARSGVFLTLGASQSVLTNSRRGVDYYNPSHFDVRQDLAFWFRQGQRLAFIHDDRKYLQLSSVRAWPALRRASMSDSDSEKYFRGDYD